MNLVCEKNIKKYSHTIEITENAIYNCVGI